MLAATLAATAPGLPFYRTLSAADFRAPSGRSGLGGGSRIAPLSTGRGLSLRPSAHQLTRGVPVRLALAPSAIGQAGAPVVYFYPAESGSAVRISAGSPSGPGASAQGADRPGQGGPRPVGEKLSDLKDRLRPELEAVQKLAASGSAESSGQAGRNIDHLLQGLKPSVSFGDAVPAPQAAGRLKGSESAPAASPLDRPITEIDFVVGDLETTGFYGEIHRPMQIGAVKIRFKENGMVEELGVFEQEMDPGMPVPAVITEFTAITDGDMKGKAPVSEGMANMRAFAGDDAVLVFHKAPFDGGMLAQAFADSGVPALGNMILDTKKMIRSIFPDIKDTKLETLIHQWNLGDLQDHTGPSDARFTVKVMKKLIETIAEGKKKSFSQLTLRDLAEHTPVETFASILEKMAPKAVEKERLVPLPADFEAQADAWSKKLHKEEKPSMLRDVAYAMGVAYDELKAALKKAAQNAAVSPADAIFEELRRDPGAGWIFDYDKTLTDNGANGLSTPTPQKVLDSLTRLLERGPVAVISSRAFDKQPKGVGFQNTIWEPLIKRIPERVRKNLLFVGNVGGELVVFDSSSKLIRVMQSDWGKAEKAVMDRVIEDAFAAVEMSAEERAAVEIAGEMNAQVVIRFIKGKEKAEAFSKKVAEGFKANQLDYPVFQNHEWVFFSKFDKQDAVRIVYPIMRERGFPVTEENLVIFGDHFRKQANGYWGVDGPMALAMPRSRGFTVGDKPTDVLPDNVRRIGITGSRGTQRAIEAIIEGLDRKASDPRRMISRVLNVKAFKLAAGALGGGLFAAALLIGQPQLYFALSALWQGLLAMTAADWAALAAAGLFFGIGAPQIKTNHDKGWEATKFLSLGSTAHWFAASVYLSAAFAALGSSPIWILSNAAGAAQAAVTAYQIIRNNRDPELYRKNLYPVLGAILSLPLVTAGAFFFPLAWAQWGVYAGIATIVLLNLPQILKNRRVYKEGGVPELNIGTPALVMAGALLNLFAALSRGEWLWAATSLASLITSGVVAGQIAWGWARAAATAGLRFAAPRRPVSKAKISDEEAERAGHDLMKAVEDRARHSLYGGRISEGDYNEMEYHAVEGLTRRGATKRQIELFRKAARSHAIPGGGWSHHSSLD